MRPPWNVEVTDEFERWWSALPGPAQESIAHDIELLRALGPSLGRPWVDTVRGSRHANMKELRTRHRRSAFRVLFAFDPHRSAILLVGGDKAGDPRFYDRMIRGADALFDRHLQDRSDEGPTR